MEGIIIRKMSHADLPQVHAIENQCYTTPWQLSSFKQELNNKESVLKVAVLENRITGYVCIRKIRDVTHILNLSVPPNFRRKGIGSLLLRDILQELRRLKPDTELTLEVRASNTAAVKLYEKFGFNIIGKRRDYYQKPDEAAIIMGLDKAAEIR